MRRAARILGAVLIAVGVLAIAWAVLVWQWQDPITAAYTHHKQGQLSDRFDRIVSEYRPPAPARTPATAQPVATMSPAQLARAARAFRKSADEGDAIARLRIPRLGLKVVVVDGTDTGTLKRGPGLHRDTFMPGEDDLVYIAGHRTTYGAPFAHIERLRPGDPITVQMPYGTFRYVVTGHAIVEADDLSVLKPVGEERLALQACHPRFFATHRYLVWARLDGTRPARTTS